VGDTSAGRLVLVVEDEPAIADLLVLHLEHAGFRARVERDGDAALEAVTRHTPDLVLLDIGLPGRDGIEVCRVLRSRGDWTPVVFLTARDDHVDRIVGLELGADDYVTKPFSPREVIARVTAVLRRSDGPGAGPGPGEVVRAGAVVCLLDERRVLVDGADVPLTATEFDLLTHLLAAPGRVFSRTQLLRDVWGHQHVSGERTVDVHVAQVRGKLGGHDVIRTVRGVGYAARTERELRG
jgi:DNA-binding response OmpR family regulator